MQVFYVFYGTHHAYLNKDRLLATEM